MRRAGVFQIALRLLWLPLGPAVGVTTEPPCRPATQCLAAQSGRGRAGQRSCALSDGSTGLRCQLEVSARQERRLGLQNLAPLASPAPDRPLRLTADADLRRAHQAGVSAVEQLRRYSERLQISGGKAAADSSSSMAIWNSPFPKYAMDMGYKALQHIETMKQMHGEGRRGRRRRRRTNDEDVTPPS